MQSTQAVQPALERRETLALSFQELITAIVRLRFKGQSVANADVFREHMKQAVRTAIQEARGKGYPDEDVKLAAFAAVAFLDESVLNSKNPAFANWSRLSLQEEMFGIHQAGETFFQSLQAVLGRRDSPQVADVLEVFYTCMLLGYRGKYGMGGGGELHGILSAVREKMQRIRGTSGEISPAWALPQEGPPPRLASGAGGIATAAAITAGSVVLLFGGYWAALYVGANGLHTLAQHIR